METIHGFRVKQFEVLLGRLLTQAEVLGLQKEQGESYKSIIKQEIWSLWDTPAYIDEKQSIIQGRD